MLVRAAGVLSMVFAIDAAAAQCALNVKPGPGETGYRKRPYACEGLYIQLQSATINTQVISLVRQKLTLPDDDSARVHVPPRLPGLRDSIVVVGRGREANLNWALDWYAKPGSPMTWRLAPVIRQVKLDATRIGVFGETKKRTGLGGPVYVPLDVRSPNEPPAQIETPPAPVELVVRIPAAGALQYRVGEGSWVSKRPYNGDGYFLLLLEAESAGVKDVELRWRPAGSAAWGSPESVSIFFW